MTTLSQNAGSACVVSLCVQPMDFPKADTERNPKELRRPPKLELTMLVITTADAWDLEIELSWTMPASVEMKPFKLGRAKPVIHGPWRKGLAGNPSARPKKAAG